VIIEILTDYWKKGRKY